MHTMYHWNDFEHHNTPSLSDDRSARRVRIEFIRGETSSPVKQPLFGCCQMEMSSVQPCVSNCESYLGRGLQLRDCAVIHVVPETLICIVLSCMRNHDKKNDAL